MGNLRLLPCPLPIFSRRQPQARPGAGCDILFYLPGRTSDFHIDYSVVILDLKRILTEIERIIPSACHSVEVLVLGDFNFRKACWDTGSSTLSEEQSLIDFLCVETSLVQIIDSPTHKSGNILDLAFFSHELKWSYTVLERDMSDHSPVILITDVVMTLENHETQFFFRTIQLQFIQGSVCHEPSAG